jgi:KDO2-lipid IV(A) lauroyltransferase
MPNTDSQRPPLTPRYWPGWLAAGFMWLLGKTPQWLALAVAPFLGWLLSALMKSRRRVAERNVERCFAEFDAEQRKAVIDGCFQSLGRMLFEMAWCWSASDRKLRAMSRIEGGEHLDAAREEGKGVLLITGHITCLEIGGRITGMAFPGCSGIYRPLKSPVLEWYQNRGRARYSVGMIRKSEMRSAIRFLRRDGILWYAPDQDFGARQSLFVPFFGIPAATLLATVKLVAATGCAVVPMFPSYDPEQRRYTVSFQPALKDFPSGSDLRDLTRINRILEAQVRQAPEQYWWIHRRFKTRPEGEAPFYA